MRQAASGPIGYDVGRSRLIARCGVAAALGWAIAEVFFELLFGPHLRPVHALSIGSGVGVSSGFVTSALQWLALRRHITGARNLLPAATLGSTLTGVAVGLLLYALDGDAELYRSALPLQGVVGAFFVGVAIPLAQWSVIRPEGERDAVAERRAWRHWLAASVAGSALGALMANIAAGLIIYVLAYIPGRGAWPYVLLAAYLVAGLSGGAVYGRVISLALRQVLPHPSHEQRAQL